MPNMTGFIRCSPLRGCWVDWRRGNTFNKYIHNIGKAGKNCVVMNNPVTTWHNFGDFETLLVILKHSATSTHHVLDHVTDHVPRSRDSSSGIFGDFETLLVILKHSGISWSEHWWFWNTFGDFETAAKRGPKHGLHARRGCAPLVLIHYFMWKYANDQ